MSSKTPPNIPTGGSFLEVLTILCQKKDLENIIHLPLGIGSKCANNFALSLTTFLGTVTRDIGSQCSNYASKSINVCKELCDTKARGMMR